MATRKKIDIVTQKELAAIMRRYNELGRTNLAVRQRIEAGAGIEPGKFSAQSDQGDPVEQYVHYIARVTGMWGLIIKDKQSTQELYEADVTPITGQPAVDPGRLDEQGHDWVSETLEECQYHLGMWEAGEPIQLIMITRPEFIALKAELARLRGYSAPQGVENAA